jgi:hypothetical protein
LDISFDLTERKKMMQYRRVCHICTGEEKIGKKKEKELHHHYLQTEQVDVS